MRIVAIIQARMGSTRLPGKILMPMAGDTMLGCLVERVRWSRLVDEVVVASSIEPEDDAVEALCRSREVPIWRGSSSDVLGRMLDAAHAHGAQAIVRLTGDNPLVDGSLIDWILERYLACDPKPDYAANCTLDPAATGFPYGLYAEIVSVAALEAASSSHDPMDREHVTWYIRNRPESFHHLILMAPGNFAYDRVTVDTSDDYAAVRRIFETHFAENPRFGFADLMIGTQRRDGGDMENAICRE